MSYQKLVQVGQVAVSALEAIDDVVNLPGGAATDAALAAVRGILAALKNGLSEGLDPQVVLARIEMVSDALASNDATVLKEMMERWK